MFTKCSFSILPVVPEALVESLSQQRHVEHRTWRRERAGGWTGTAPRPRPAGGAPAPRAPRAPACSPRRRAPTAGAGLLIPRPPLAKKIEKSFKSRQYC